MTGEAKTTINHRTIKKWAEARGGKPVSIKGTERDDDVGILRIDFPGYSGAESLEEITWDAFFKKFDEKQLAFLYQEQTSSGEESRFFKLVSRASIDDKTPKSEPRKVESKTGAKTHRSENRSDEKAPKTEGKNSHKTRKAESKPAAKAHKTAEKSHKATRK